VKTRRDVKLKSHKVVDEDCELRFRRLAAVNEGALLMEKRDFLLCHTWREIAKLVVEHPVSKVPLVNGQENSKDLPGIAFENMFCYLAKEICRCNQVH
jgi:hypothetical protein